MCTVADDCQALIWDLTDMKMELTGLNIYFKCPFLSFFPSFILITFELDPFLEYKADAEISNLSWSLLQNDWLAICFHKNLQILKV